MNKPYPYRFRTLEEYETEFGSDWRCCVCFNMDGLMDFLCGTVFPFYDVKENMSIKYKNWAIDRRMLIVNEKCTPNYKPKKIIKSLDDYER